MNEEMGALILNELSQMRRDGQTMLEKVIRIEETVKDVGDHEARIRVLEAELPDDAKSRITALEKWRWTAMGALGTAGASLASQIYNAVKGG